MTEQEIFDKVVNHLLTQNFQSMGYVGADEYDDEICAYRSSEGLKCAIGCLIPDDLYDMGMESLSISSLCREFKLPDFFFENQSLLELLQYIHDYKSPESWRMDLEDLAKKRNLQFNWEEK